MDKIISGKAHTFGKNIDTDQIYPGRYLELVKPEDIAKHAMEGADPKFLDNYTKGDIIIAGKNFGCGSSREHAAITLKTIGVGAVISESFGRIFYRNSINLGLPLMVCQGIKEFVEEGDKLEIDLEEGIVRNTTKNKILNGEKLPEFVLEMMEAGGIKQYYINKNIK